MINTYDIIIIGGGAAGFFAAINAAKENPSLNIAIFERGQEVLQKVKISGGGRCNVTHAEFIPKDLSENYPRGEKELLGPFHSFMTGDTITWFEERGVPLKIEEDGRMFPTSDDSQTIIDCFLSATKHHRISVLRGHPVRQIKTINDRYAIHTPTEVFEAKKILVATGSNPKIWNVLENMGHNIVPPVPSLFTFNIKDNRINELAGIATQASVAVLSEDHKTILDSEGPLLITHWGMSGPAILKLSAWGARLLAPLDYKFNIRVNWLLDKTVDEVLANLMDLKMIQPKQSLKKYAHFDVPKRLWRRLLLAANIVDTVTWAEVTKKQLGALAEELTAGIFEVTGKSTFKEEFVTAGGVDLKEVDCKTFESKIHANLYFSGEVLNVDAITGGFNFQHAWTSGYLAAQSLAKS